MKIYYAVFLFCLPFFAQSQNNLERELDSIKTSEEASSFIKDNKSHKGKIITFNKAKHNTSLAEELFKLSKGGKKVYKNDFSNTYYKVIEKTATPYFKLSIIYLDGTKKSMEEINKIRSTVLYRYNEGYKFKDLARLYSMDQSAKTGGDLGWLTNGDLNADFEEKIKATDELIFTVDMPEQNGYFVVLKTENPRLIEEIKVLRLTETKK
ncbi:peptidylprolyl isomerase [Ichthyenterobacterium sp. W332]|uniref:Peptidylprolyl isomerase n=1 Tax=Microcosmobacter mediterraneus TaxID=3075607 RepID=A0ABU2YMR9_9FLAO|nr:peptidylprolyl isomerase [Ichthyenterobacterium sp. W332]MDT0559181.1 peptidylprolyl isomerase [Ichthyenterobacterium sp. W332]